MKKIIFVMLVCLLQFSSVSAKENVYELTTAVSGVVEKVLVKPGDKVKKGQVLLILDQRVIKANYLAAEKSVTSANLTMQEAKKELERTETLYEQTVISDHELELAKVNFAKTELQHADAQRSKTHAQYQLDYSQIIAPASGKVLSIDAWPGMVVNNQFSAVTLITLSK